MHQVFRSESQHDDHCQTSVDQVCKSLWWYVDRNRPSGRIASGVEENGCHDAATGVVENPSSEDAGGKIGEDQHRDQHPEALVTGHKDQGDMPAPLDETKHQRIVLELDQASTSL